MPRKRLDSLVLDRVQRTIHEEKVLRAAFPEYRFDRHKITSLRQMLSVALEAQPDEFRFGTVMLIGPQTKARRRPSNEAGPAEPRSAYANMPILWFNRSVQHRL